MAALGEVVVNGVADDVSGPERAELSAVPRVLSPWPLGRLVQSEGIHGSESIWSKQAKVTVCDPLMCLELLQVLPHSGFSRCQMLRGGDVVAPGGGGGGIPNLMGGKTTCC